MPKIYSFIPKSRSGSGTRKVSVSAGKKWRPSEKHRVQESTISTYLCQCKCGYAPTLTEGEGEVEEGR